MLHGLIFPHSWRNRQEVPPHTWSACRGRLKLCRQQRCQVPIPHRTLWFRCTSQSSARCWCGRHGCRICQERQARTKEENYARSGRPTAQGLAAAGRCFPLLRGQRWGDRQQQGRYEGFRHRRTCSKRMCRPMASYRSKSWYSSIAPRCKFLAPPFHYTFFTPFPICIYIGRSRYAMIIISSIVRPSRLADCKGDSTSNQ